jgi:hypothetical protein
VEKLVYLLWSRPDESRPEDAGDRLRDRLLREAARSA